MFTIMSYSVIYINIVVRLMLRIISTHFKLCAAEAGRSLKWMGIAQEKQEGLGQCVGWSVNGHRTSGLIGAASIGRRTG